MQWKTKPWLLVLLGLGLLSGCEEGPDYGARAMHGKVLDWIEKHDDSVSFFGEGSQEWTDFHKMKLQGKYLGALSLNPRSPETEKMMFKYSAYYQVDGMVYAVPLMIVHENPYTTKIGFYDEIKLAEPKELERLKHY